MIERAAHLIDHVLPRVPVRQWVLSLPFELRYRLAWDHKLCRAVLAVYTRALLGFYRKRAKAAGHRDGRTGTVTVIQRFGGALNLNVHFHTLVVDGVFVSDPDGSLSLNGADRAAGIANFGTLTMTNCTVSGNTARFLGGGINNDGTMTMTDSTVAGNTGEQGGGINNNSTLVLTNVTVSGNTATILFPFASGSGGGISNLVSGTLTLTNSTVSGNAASSTSGGILSFGTLTLTNSTVAGNVAPQIQGIRNGSRGTLTITKTVVEGDCATESEATTTSGGYNIESPGDTCSFDQLTDQVNITEAQLTLGPLRDNSGPTETHALGAGSVAIDMIPEEECLDADGAPLTTDQRGLPRPVAILGPEPMCDVGAFEVQP